MKFGKQYMLSLFLLGVLTLGGCSKDDAIPDDPTPDQPIPEPSDSDTTATKGIVCDKPTDWVVTSTVDPTTSMTLTIAVTGLPQEAEEGDMMSAFVGDDCRGVTEAITQYGITRFYLPVARVLTDDVDNPPMVTLYYYSVKAGRLYTSASDIVFERDGRYGTIEEPYQPEWK